MPVSVPADGHSRSLLKTAFLCIALLAGGAGLIFVIFNTEPTAQRDGAVRQSASLVDVTQAEIGDFRPSIVAMGTVRPSKEINLSARVQGEIIEISENFLPGGYVDA
ncbi:MAG TPA: hypothetical protein VKO38_07135, partial [Wenzhouxiangella sp.]|nr:hypothetical protein [Wenzhouxiangella sp.]